MSTTVLATAKFTSFLFLLKNEDAYFRERRRIFQRTKAHKTKDAKKKHENANKGKKRKKKRNAKKTHKNEDAKERIGIGALYTSLQIIKSAFVYEKCLDCLLK